MIHVLVLSTGYVESNSVAKVTVRSQQGFETAEAAITDLANFLFKGWSRYYDPPVAPHPECYARHGRQRLGGWADDFVDYCRTMMNWDAASGEGPMWDDEAEHDWWPWDNFHIYAQYQPCEIVEVHEYAAEILLEALTDLPEIYEKTRWVEESDFSSPRYFTEKELKFHLTVAPEMKRPPYNVLEHDGKLYLIKSDQAVRLEEEGGAKRLDLAATIVIDPMQSKLTKNMIGPAPK